MSAATLFNSQRLLFDKTRSLRHASAGVEIPEHYYEHGWTVLDAVADAEAAIDLQEKFIRSVNPRRVPQGVRFAKRVQLAKADQIPVCDDIVSASFQVLHFDMGLPFLPDGEGQLLITHVGIYLPANTKHAVTARTRLVELGDLVRTLGLTDEQIETRLLAYVEQYGDGWVGHNTYRLACFARVLDAISNRHKLAGEIDKTVGQWFQNDKKLDADSAYQQESLFYAAHGIDLPAVEHRIALEPGQLLLLDNLRVIHGRIGHRKSQEIYNFMFGLPDATASDISALRRDVCTLIN